MEGVVMEKKKEPAKKGNRHSTTVYIPRSENQEEYLRAINVAAQLRCGPAKALGKFSEYTNKLFRQDLKALGLMSPEGQINSAEVQKREKEIEEERKRD
jgi:cation transport regulator ChaC